MWEQLPGQLSYNNSHTGKTLLVGNSLVSWAWLATGLMSSGSNPLSAACWVCDPGHLFVSPSPHLERGDPKSIPSKINIYLECFNGIMCVNDATTPLPSTLLLVHSPRDMMVNTPTSGPLHLRSFCLGCLPPVIPTATFLISFRFLFKCNLLSVTFLEK